jgi:hypothetical protein
LTVTAAAVPRGDHRPPPAPGSSSRQEYVNQRPVEAGVHIERIELGDGTVSFAGDLPQTIETAAPEPDAVP